MSELVTVKSGSGGYGLYFKKQYLVNVPEGEFGLIGGLAKKNVTDDKIMFDVKGDDISQYKVKIFSYHYSEYYSDRDGPVPNGHYVMLMKGDGKGGAVMVGGVRIGGDPDFTVATSPEELKGGNKDFSNTICIKTSDGKIHRIANPELQEQPDRLYAPVDPNVTRLDTLAKFGYGAEINHDLAKELIALKAALGGDEAATLEALKATLAGAKAKAENPALSPK